jgi:hypothetical protein
MLSNVILNEPAAIVVTNGTEKPVADGVAILTRTIEPAATLLFVTVNVA